MVHITASGMGDFMTACRQSIRHRSARVRLFGEHGMRHVSSHCRVGWPQHWGEEANAIGGRCDRA